MSAIFGAFKIRHLSNHVKEAASWMQVSTIDPARCIGCQACVHACGELFTPKMQTEDLKKVLSEPGMDYRFEDGTHDQDVCLQRRRLLAINQLEAIGGPGFL